MRMKRRLLYGLIVLFGIHALSCLDAKEHAGTVAEIVAARMEQEREGGADSDIGVLADKPRQALAALKRYRSDPSPRVQVGMMRDIMRIKVGAKDAPELHRDMVDTILAAFLASHGKPQGRLVRDQAVGFLKRFRADDFGDDAKATIRTAFKKQGMSRSTVELYALAGMKTDLTELRKAFNAHRWPPYDETWYQSLQWTYRRVLAELGDSESSAHCIKKVEEEADLRVKARGLVDIARIRNDDIIALLKKHLDGDEMIKGLHGSYPLSGCAVQALAEILEGFPVEEKNHIWYSESDIARCREWTARQTKWKFKEF